MAVAAALGDLRRGRGGARLCDRTRGGGREERRDRRPLDGGVTLRGPVRAGGALLYACVRPDPGRTLRARAACPRARGGGASLAAGRAARRLDRLRAGTRGGAQRPPRLAWAPALAAVCLCSKTSLADGANWAPPETVGTIWSARAPVYLLRISDFITFGLAPAAVPGLSAAVAALAALGLWRLRRAPAVLAVVGGAAFLVPLGMRLLSPIVPVLVPR